MSVYTWGSSRQIPSTNKCLLIMQLSWSSSKLMPHHRTQCNETKQAIWISSSAPHSNVLRGGVASTVSTRRCCSRSLSSSSFRSISRSRSLSALFSLLLFLPIYACTTLYLFLTLADTLQSYHVYDYRLYRSIPSPYTCACLSSIIAYVTILNTLSMRSNGHGHGHTGHTGPTYPIDAKVNNTHSFVLNWKP